MTNALPVTEVLEANELDPPTEKIPDGLTNPTAKPVTPEAFGAGSEAENPIATLAGAAVTFTTAGDRVRLADKTGGVVSGVEDNVIVVGNARLVISAAAKTEVLPAASVMIQFVTVQIPASLNLGKTSAAVQVVESPGEQSVATFTVLLTELSVEGLAKVICQLAAPETSSVRVKFMFTETGPDVVSIEVAERVNVVIVGGVVSTIEVTCRLPGLFGSAPKPNGPRKVKLEDVSNRRAYPTVHAPAGLNRGKVTFSVLVTDAPAGNEPQPGMMPPADAQPRLKFTPVESTKPTSM